MSRILITGGAGFVGQQIARQLLKDGQHTIILTDIVDPPIPSGFETSSNIVTEKGNLCTDSARILEHACWADGSPPNAVIILHGIMSGKSESDFDLGMAVNVDGTRALLEALRAKTSQHPLELPRVIFASSLAVYGPPFCSKVSETTKPSPQSSYGAEKAICEILVCEYSRREFIDGLVLRFPTVSVRPGVPAPAASAFLSGLIREPLNGVETEVPIDDDSFESWLCSPSTLITNLCHALALPPGAETNTRVINLPGIVVSIADMLHALEKFGGKDALGFVKRKADPAAERILRSWPVQFDITVAEKLGFQRDNSFEDITKQYVEYLAQDKQT
jgi:nucleoside-diphosphate-sugar epimerase